MTTVANHPGDIPWKDVFDVLSTRDVKMLAKLSGVSKNARGTAAALLNGIANRELQSSSVITDDVGALTPEQMAALADFCGRVVGGFQELRERLGSRVTPTAIMAFYVVSDRLHRYTRKEYARIQNPAQKTALFDSLPPEWTDWSTVSPHDIVEHVKAFYARRGMKGKHPAHYESKYLLGLKALSAMLARVPEQSLPLGVSEFKQAIAVDSMRRVSAFGRMYIANHLVLEHSRDIMDAYGVVGATNRLIYALALRGFSARAPSADKMNLVAAAERSRDPALRGAAAKLREARPDEDLLRKARLQLSADIAHMLGIKADPNDECDVLRVIYFASLFLVVNPRTQDAYNKLLADDSFPDCKHNAKSFRWKAMLALWGRHRTFDVGDELLRNYDYEKRWPDLKRRALKLRGDIQWNFDDLNKFARSIEALRKPMFEAPYAPMRELRDADWADIGNDASPMYARALRDVFLLLFRVLTVISAKWEAPRRFVAPFRKADWHVQPRRPSELHAYLELNRKIKEYRQQH